MKFFFIAAIGGFMVVNGCMEQDFYSIGDDNTAAHNTLNTNRTEVIEYIRFNDDNIRFNDNNIRFNDNNIRFNDNNNLTSNITSNNNTLTFNDDHVILNDDNITSNDFEFEELIEIKKRENESSFFMDFNPGIEPVNNRPESNQHLRKRNLSPKTNVPTHRPTNAPTHRPTKAPPTHRPTTFKKGIYLCNKDKNGNYYHITTLLGQNAAILDTFHARCSDNKSIGNFGEIPRNIYQFFTPLKARIGFKTMTVYYGQYFLPEQVVIVEICTAIGACASTFKRGLNICSNNKTSEDHCPKYKYFECSSGEFIVGFEVIEQYWISYIRPICG